MKNFNLYNPVNVIFGNGESKKVGEVAKEIGKNVLLVSYEEHSFFNSLIDDIRSSLNVNDIKVTEFFKIQANPLLSHIREAVALCKEKNIDLCIAIGGGSVMDSTKIIAAGVKYKYDLWKMFISRHDVEVACSPTESLPTIMIPTLPATSSEMNCIAVATNDETTEKAYVYTTVIYPTVSIIDPALTCSLPTFQTASGAIDAISHVLEAYFNGDQNSPLQDRLQEGLVITIISELKKVLADPSNIEHRSNIQWASTLAWNGWIQAGLDATTPMHQMGHVLSARYNTTHGVTLAIFMASFFRYTCALNAERASRFALFGEKIFGLSREGHTDVEVGIEAIDLFVNFMKSVNIPTTLSEVQISENDFEAIADDIVRLGCDSNGNLPSIPPIGRDGIIEVLKLAK